MFIENNSKRKQIEQDTKKNQTTDNLFDNCKVNSNSAQGLSTGPKFTQITMVFLLQNVKQ